MEFLERVIQLISKIRSALMLGENTKSIYDLVFSVFVDFSGGSG